MKFKKLIENQIRALNETRLNEYNIAHQPNLGDNQTGTIIADGEEIKIQRNPKTGNKVYFFGPKASAYINRLDKRSPENRYLLNKELALIFWHNEEFGNILQNADKDDQLVFQTAKDGKVVVDVADIYAFLPLFKRQERYGDEIGRAIGESVDLKEDTVFDKDFFKHTALSIASGGLINPTISHSLANEKMFNQKYKAPSEYTPKTVKPEKPVKPVKPTLSDAEKARNDSMKIWNELDSAAK